MTDIEMLVAQFQMEKAERMAVAEYAASRDPIGLLRRRVYELIACSAASVIDFQTTHPPITPLPGWPGESPLSKTEERLTKDPLFHRLVDMQVSGIVKEVERFEEGIGLMSRSRGGSVAKAIANDPLCREKVAEIKEHRAQASEQCAAHIAGINHLLAEVQRIKAENSSLRLGYWHNPGSILNAYREGDISFDVAVAKLSEPSPRKVYSLRPASEWHDDDGAVLWWHLPVCEPPEVGCGPGAGEQNADGKPTTCARQIEEGWLTHWSPLPDPKKMTATDGTEVEG